MKTTETKHQSRRFRHFLRANEAVAALEYALLVGVVAVAIGAALVTFAGSVDTAIDSIGTGISTLTQTTPKTK